MAIPTVTREYTTGSHRNLRKHVILPPRREMWKIPMHCWHSNSVLPIKHVRSLALLDGTPDNPQEHPHNSGRTLMLTQGCEIDRCSPNQLEMMPDSPALAPEQSSIPHRT